MAHPERQAGGAIRARGARQSAHRLRDEAGQCRLSIAWFQQDAAGRTGGTVSRYRGARPRSRGARRLREGPHRDSWMPKGRAPGERTRRTRRPSDAQGRSSRRADAGRLDGDARWEGERSRLRDGRDHRALAGRSLGRPGACCIAESCTRGPALGGSRCTQLHADACEDRGAGEQGRARIGRNSGLSSPIRDWAPHGTVDRNR